MPKKLDSCVKQVKSELMKDGVPKKVAEQRAWAICKDKLKMQSSRDLVEEFARKVNELIDNIIKE